MIAVLLQIDGYDPVPGSTVVLRACNLDDERVCHLNGETWLPALAKLPALRYDLFDGAFEGKISTPQSSLVLAAELWPNLGRYSLAGMRLRLWTGTPSAAWGGYTLRFDGRVTAQPVIADGVATVSFAVDDRWLDQPLLATYAGTGGAEGEAARKGLPKPLALGAPRFVPGQMIDGTNNVVQLSGYGAIEDVEAAYERLSSFGAVQGDSASYSALVAATVPAGYWRTAEAVGMVRHGAPPAGLLSYHVKGDKAGPDGWVRKPGAVIKRIGLIGGGSGRISEASVDALDTARPWNVSIYQAEQTSGRELIQRLAASVNAVAGVDWLGQLFVAPVGFGTPAMTLDATGAAEPAVERVEQLQIDAPWWRLAIGAERTWAVHPLGDVAFTATLVERGEYDDAESYREGHIVSLGDGSRWLYTAAAASIGNDPVAGSSYWTMIAGPLVALSARLTNWAHNLTADAAGNVASYAGAGGSVQVFDGGVDVSTSFSLSTAPGGNPQGLTVNYTGQAYSVTAGLDAGEPGATLTIRATGSGTYSGTHVDGVFSLAKSIGGAPGSNGANGLNNARVRIYQRAASAPSLPSATTTYTFATGALTGLDNGWSTTIPAANGNPLYVSEAIASSATATDTIAAGEWAAAVIMAQDGATGGTGINSATVFLYQRTSTATPPSTPAGSLTYTFATGALSGSLGSWAQSLPTSGGSYRWVTTAAALSAAATDTIGSGEWATPSILAEDGAPGTAGTDATVISSDLAVLSVDFTTGGVAKSLQLPKSAQFRLRKGATEVTTSASWSVISIPSGFAGTIGSSTGAFSLTSAAPVAGELKVRAAYLSVNYDFTLPLSFTRDPLPPSGIASISVQPSTVAAFGGTSYFSPYFVYSVSATAAGEIEAALSASYTPETGSGGGTKTLMLGAKLAYRAQGTTTWYDFSYGEVTGDNMVVTGDSYEAGSLSASMTQSGLTANAGYEIGLFYRRVNSGGSAWTDGTVINASLQAGDI